MNQSNLFQTIFGAFHKSSSNPVLSPRADTIFPCPLNGDLAWEAKDVFNPAAIVHNGKVHLLYRAEDYEGRHAGTSRIGLATSEDGVNFTREPHPILFPADDEFKVLEWEGGCEDPAWCKRRTALLC
jgi:predicted GH43/DUF377 family glycosyl hydrolase